MNGTNYPNGTNTKVFDSPQEKSYIVEITGFIEVQAYDREDAEELAKEKLLDADLKYFAIK